jgi:hypothetical protein
MKGNGQMTLVCAWCDVYCRVECENEFQSWTVCAYCGRSELRLSKLGRQTPLPKDDVGGADDPHAEFPF